MFKAITTVFTVAILSMVFANTASAQWHHHDGVWHNHPQNQYHWHGYGGQILYAPQVTWYPQGTYLGVGPVTVSPDRRYVRFGINAGFSTYLGHSTFNFRTGESRWYGRNDCRGNGRGRR